MHIDDATHSVRNIRFCRKMQHARELWCTLATFDVFKLSKILSAKCTPYSLIFTKVTLFLMDCKVMTNNCNQGTIESNNFSFKGNPNFIKLQIPIDCLIPNQTDCPENVVVTSYQHQNGILRNDSLLRPGPHPTLRLLCVKSTFGIRHAYCRSIGTEIGLC